MTKSLFLDYTERHFKGIVLAQYRKLNGISEGAVKPYLFQKYLDTRFSIDGRYSTLTGLFKNVIADYVDIDSPAPLKSRGSKGVATGEIPDISNKYQLTAKQIRDIRAMKRDNVNEQQIIDELFADAKLAQNNIYELHDYSFIKSLCEGVLEVDQEVSDGVSVRASFGYKDANQFKVTTVNSISVQDVEQIFNKAKLDGNIVDTVFIDAVALGRIAKSQSFKEEFAFDAGFVGTTIPNLTTAKIAEFFKRKWNCDLETGVDRGFLKQRSGVDTTLKAWTDGIIIFTSAKNLGSLVWSYTIEHDSESRADGVKYVEAGHILLSKFSETDPYTEVTKADAKALPVIANADGIYRLDSNVAITPAG